MQLEFSGFFQCYTLHLKIHLRRFYLPFTFAGTTWADGACIHAESMSRQKHKDWKEDFLSEITKCNKLCILLSNSTWRQSLSYASDNLLRNVSICLLWVNIGVPLHEALTILVQYVQYMYIFWIRNSSVE